MMQMKNTLYVNLFGSPGAGKSSGAAYVFAKLKMINIDCEYVQEYAKDKVWEHDDFIFSKPENQFYIGAKQFYRLNRLNGQVSVVITDSPLYLNALYNHSDLLGDEYTLVLKRLASSFHNLNFFIKRVKPYNPNGRIQTEEQANIIEKNLQNQLQSFNCQIVSGDANGYETIFQTVKHHISDI